MNHLPRNSGIGGKKIEIAGSGVDKIWDLVTDSPTTSYRFGRQPENHRFRFAKNKFLNLFIIDVEYGTDVEKITIPENGSYLISAINAGTAQFELSGKEIDGRPGSVVALSAGMHQRILHQADTRKTVVVIPKENLQAYLQQLNGSTGQEAPDFQIAAADPVFARRWMSFLAFVHETTRAGTLSVASEMLIEEQFMRLLLEHHPHTHVESVRRTSSVQPYVVREAQRFIEREAHRPLSIGEIATAAGCSIRSLQRGFEENLKTTPRAYLVAKRLELARTALATAARETTVTQIATDLGFMHLGQFAAAFKARFGLSPRAMLRREA